MASRFPQPPRRRHRLRRRRRRVYSDLLGGNLGR